MALVNPEPPITVAASHHGGIQTVVNRVVIHDEEYGVGPNSAEDIAHYFSLPTTQYQAHYVADQNSIQHCVPENTIAFHAPPNEGSVGIEQDGYAHMTREEWMKVESLATIHNAAVTARDICDRWGIPKVWLSVADLLAGKRGITSHLNVTNAFHVSTHTDPGEWYPIDIFMAVVTDTGGGDELSPADLLQIHAITRIEAIAVEQVAGWFRTDKGREPDPGGFAFWVGEYTAPGADLIVVHERFLAAGP